MRRLLLSIIDRQTLISARNSINSLQNLIFSAMDSLLPDPTSSSSITIDSSSPPQFDPLEPSIPISFPIKDLEYLKSRAYFDSFHYPFNISSIPLPKESTYLADRRRILVCHDMAGGYTDDKWIQGGDNPDAYSIWHWYLMDVFVYFSHNLVTLPPPSWINAAHTHCVKVLGTFITEWDEGKLICDQLLSTKESAQMYAERLTELAVALGFDGWLINIEVQLDVEQIPNMKEFVNHLTQTMHSSKPGSLVIWYDSVTVDGYLNWQDQLNNNNKPFFDLSDGIFVNYTWHEDYPKFSAEVAGERKFDVYMGIDVFGRNTYGGGQWTTDVALDVLKKDNVSAAIFAPGWVYENKEPPDFQTAQNRWWGLIEKSWGILQHYPKSLPFYSNFDQGHGYHFSVDGRQVSNDPWCNISCQSFQPVLDNSVGLAGETIQVLVDFKDACYNGGGSIVAKGALASNEHFTKKLFQGELALGDLPIHITYSVRSNGSSLIGLNLVCSYNTNERTSVLLASSGDTLITMNQFAGKFDKVIMPHRVTKLDAEAKRGKGWVIQENSIAMNGYTLTEIHMVCYRSKQELRVEQDPASQGIALPSASPEYYASLGHIAIKNSEQRFVFPRSTSWVVDGEHITWIKSNSKDSKSLSFKLFWRLENDDHGTLFPKYNIYVSRIAKQALDGKMKGSKEYLGVASVQAFYISDLVVSGNISSLEFFIQVCGIDGECQELDSCPTFLMDVEGGPGTNKAYWTGIGFPGAMSLANKTVFQIQKWGGECWIWTSILKWLEVIKRFISWRVGNGISRKLASSSEASKENWVREMFPSDMADKVIQIHACANALADRLIWPMKRGQKQTSYDSISSGANYEMAMEDLRECR